MLAENLSSHHKPLPSHTETPIAQPATVSLPDELKSPTSEFSSAMHRIRESREQWSLSESLMDAVSWGQSTLFEPLVSALRTIKDTVINKNVMVPVTAFMTFVFNPVLFSELRAGSGPTLDLLIRASS